YRKGAEHQCTHNALILVAHLSNALDHSWLEHWDQLSSRSRRSGKRERPNLSLSGRTAAFGFERTQWLPLWRLESRLLTSKRKGRRRSAFRSRMSLMRRGVRTSRRRSGLDGEISLGMRIRLPTSLPSDRIGLTCASAADTP